MPTDKSFLSGPKYGYDFVVSTTQASINSGLLKFLSESDQPVEYICFLVDVDTGNPKEQISLDELLNLSGGVNPFDIPAGTAYSDSRIQKLKDVRFCVGIKLQMGLPPGIPPKDLPLVVTLGSSADSVGFNLFCSQFTVIQNSPPSGWGNDGSWGVWEQPLGKAWYFGTKVDLVVADLDKELDTPYFNSHLAEKAALKNQLMNLSETAFSLQQLFYDLENAALQTMPTIEGIDPESNATSVLSKSFIPLYRKGAKERGFPLVSVTATVQAADTSQLQMTNFERQVSQLKDSNGAVIQDPTPEQQAATTLDCLCAANNNKLPGVSSFNWNWVTPREVDEESGVIAINRNTIADFFIKEILPTAKSSCLRIIPDATAYWWKVKGDLEISPITAGQKPQTAEVTSEGENVIFIEYSDSKKDEDWSAASYCGFVIEPYYRCDVKFSGNNITITQRARVHIWACFDNTEKTLNPYDKTRIDNYSISVSQTGSLRVVKSGSSSEDDSESPDTGGFIDFFTGIDSVVDDIKKQLKELDETSLSEVPFDQLQAFVFPGSKTFTYKSASFSKHQDLVCGITYVDPSSINAVRSRLQETEELRDGVVPRNVTAPNGLKLAYSSEMMDNYVQGEIVSPTGKLEAVQTSDGHALLFAIDTSGIFHVMKEQSGSTSTGWEVDDLCSSLIAADFPNKNAKARTFDVGQSMLDGNIGLAMAVSDGDDDILYISLYNFSSDTSWTSKPSWTSIPFDAVAEKPPTISIVGVMFAETAGQEQYLIVDIDRSTTSDKHIARYYIDPLRSTGSYWVKHDVPVDIEDGSYQSCVGQVKNGYIDGVYTSGSTGGAPQLVYVPILNVFGSGPPLPRRLALPGGVLQSAIAAARHTDQSSGLRGFTDLFSISGSTLYRFAADAQKDGATAQPLFTSSVLSDTDQLLAMTHEGVTTRELAPTPSNYYT